MMITDCHRRLRRPVVPRIALLVLGLLSIAAWPGPAAAADIATGGMLGSVDVQPGAQAVVLLRYLDTGAMATLTPDADGNYRVNGIPVGRYEVVLMLNGKSVANETVDVVTGFAVTVPELYPRGQ